MTRQRSGYRPRKGGDARETHQLASVDAMIRYFNGYGI
jgi:hypothetical protein